MESGPFVSSRLPEASGLVASGSATGGIWNLSSAPGILRHYHNHHQDSMGSEIVVFSH